MGELIAGRWELREPIASGATSTVWHAFDHTRGEPCAAKLLRQRDAGQMLRFAREQSRRLTGTHLVAPYAWVADDGTALIAFELVRGGSLRSLIGDYGALSDATVVTILDQLLDALDVVHRARIIHRDVTPANILLRATGRGPIDVALADFGIAVAAAESRLTTVGMVTGTPGYMPPEVLREPVVPVPAHDIYALGLVAVALVLGYEDGVPDQALACVEDPHLARAISAMTRPDPRERAGDVADVRELLAGAVRAATPTDREGEPITVLEHVPLDDAVEAAPAAPKAPRLARRLVISGALLAGVGAAGVLWSVLGDQPAETVPPPKVLSKTPSPSLTRTPTAPQKERGAECSWQVEGDRAVDADGSALVCRRIDGAYVWDPQ
ncbi:MAG: serine/threonine-protein kinase [Arachnia sp.]